MRHIESDIQKAFVKWFRLQYPQYALNLMSVPNGGARRKKEYSRTRSGRALSDSKRLEQEIDAEIDHVNKMIAEKQNPKMKF